MIMAVPSNVVPWLIGAIILLPLGLRSWVHSQKVKTPISRYFAATGLLGGLALACYSLPSLFTSDPWWLKAGIFVGIPFLYSMLAVQVYYVWYSLFQAKFSFKWLFTPVAAIASITAIFELVYTVNDSIYIADNELIYGFSSFSRYAQSLLLLLVLLNGLLFFKQALGLREMWAKLRLISLGLLYILVSLVTIIDNIAYVGQNTSPYLLYGYALSAVVFFITLIVVLRKQKV